MKALRFNTIRSVECLYAPDYDGHPFSYQTKSLTATTDMGELIAWLTSEIVQAPDFTMSGFSYGRNYNATILMQVEKRGTRYMVSRYNAQGGFRNRDFIGLESLPDLMDEIKNILFITV